MENWGAGPVYGLGALVVAAITNVDRLFGLFKNWRTEKRDAAASVVEGAGAAVDVMKNVMEAVEKRLEASEAECERRIKDAITQIRQEWEHERRGLRATILALADLLPPGARARLDEKLRAIVDEIAPEATDA